MYTPFTLLNATIPDNPIVFDSPHSGRDYPPDFKFTCPRPVLERAEDRFLDKLLTWAPDQGIPLLLAHFPRSYIDLNRAVTDIDVTMLDGPWPDAQPTELSHAGIGLIRRLLTPTLSVYNAPIAVSNLHHRIENYYIPYHTALAKMIAAAQRRHGCVLHINWHSMPSRYSGTIRMPDFVIGSRHGTTCPLHIVETAQKSLHGMGHSVQINDPYPGQEIIRRTGRPDKGHFALQIEINKALYLEEGRNKLHAGHTTLIKTLQRFTATMINTMQDDAVPLAAD